MGRHRPSSKGKGAMCPHLTHHTEVSTESVQKAELEKLQ